jgi:hypothetical protein
LSEGRGAVGVRAAFTRWGLVPFFAVHAILIAVSFFAFVVDLSMYFNEGGTGVNGWSIAIGTYVWLASLLTITVGNYLALQRR